MAAHHPVDLLLTITGSAGGNAVASLELLLPNRVAELVADAPITVVTEQLLALQSDPDSYGIALTGMVFTAPLRLGWERAYGFSERDGAALRVRVELKGDERLHALRWELLRVPGRATPLAHNERVLLSRYLPNSSLSDPQVTDWPALQALVAVADPAASQLPSIDVAAEVARAQAGLSTIPTTVIDGREGRPLPTLAEIVGALRRGVQILYLVCHGGLVDGEPYLWLEQEGTGSYRPTPGGELVRAITQLQQRPLLLVLASCEGAGNDEAALTAIGPQMAREGVGAVIAMHGQVPQALVGLLTRRLFSELLADGQIDRALAAARAALPADSPWWMPVLWMAVRDGALWKANSKQGELALPAPGEPPFKGLLAFGTGDEALFCGREQLVARCIGHLRTSRFLAIVGASGSGKSSVVCAGIIPALATGRPLADGSQPPAQSESWPIHILTPTAHPLEALAASMTRDSESVTATMTLIDDLANGPRALHLAVRKLVSGGRGAPAPSERLLLVVDQFEELFTLCKDETERRAFIDNLLHAVDADLGGPLTVIITLRADFYDDCGQYAHLRDVLASQQLYIGAMSRAELREAIEEPARRSSWEFEPGLVERILDDVGTEPGALPLLSHALLETWRRRSGRQLTHTGYSAAGGVRGAISETAERVFTQLSAEQQRVAQAIFLRLVEVDEPVVATRRRSQLSELASSAETATTVDTVLKQLADARLITVSEDSAEVAHEALISEWTTLRQWVNENRPSLRIHHRLADAALEWQRLNQDAGLLYRGLRLDEALAWASTNSATTNALEEAFLAASQQERALERARARQFARLRRLARVAGALLALALLLAWPAELLYHHLLKWQTLNESPMEPIAGGDTIFGTTVNERDYGERPARRLPVAPFRIDRYEVTNEQYARCLRARSCATPPLTTEFFGKADYSQHPVVNITAQQAAAYCAWLGRRLPDEVEWERTARGPEQAAWPWGDAQPSPELEIWPVRTPKSVGSCRSGAAPPGRVARASTIW